MVVYRISRPRHAKALDGEGARITKGRWNPLGIPVVYTSSSVALAAVEVYVHVRQEIAAVAGLLRVDIELPDNSALECLEVADLPVDWANVVVPNSTIEIGRRWAAECRSLALRVPSAALSGHEYNYILNPLHPDMKFVKIVKTVPFVFDPRML